MSAAIPEPVDLIHEASTAALEDVATYRAIAARAEAHAMARAAEFCLVNATFDEAAAARVVAHGKVTDLALAGEGAPLVAETAVVEFAAAMGLSDQAARAYLGDVLEVSQRLGRTWERVAAGEVPSWKARLIAQQTRTLSPEAAAHVDAQVAGIAHAIGPTRLAKAVEEARALFDPEEAARRAAAAAELRRVSVCKDAPVDGVVYVDAALDLADALDLDAALALVAAELAGDPDNPDRHDPLQVRRSKALGVMARRTLAGDLAGDHAGQQPRSVQLYLHLDRDLAETGLVRVESPETLATIAQVKTWCATPGTPVRITPVLDLAATHSRDGYVPTETMREQATLVDQTCVFPCCTRRARGGTDLDHIEPYVPHDDDGPPGQTSSANLGSLCRLHHRMKTHAGWAYRKLAGGLYHWRSPTGRHYLRTPTGTYPLSTDPP